MNHTILMTDTALGAWGADQFNSLTAVACTIAGIVCIPRLIMLAPYLWGSLLRWKETASLYASVRLSRERDILALVCIVPLCLLASRYSLLRLKIMDNMPPWAVTLCVIGLFVAYLIARSVFFAVTPRIISGDEGKIARSNSASGFIVITLTSLVCAGICSLLKMDDMAAATVLKHLIVLIFAVVMYRNFEILSWKGQRFKAFLYLCALELVPAGLLVAGTIIF